MTANKVSKSNIYFQDLKLMPNGYFTGEIDAWDLDTPDLINIGAENKEILEIDGYVDFDERGYVTKIIGLSVWNGKRKLTMNPTETLIYDLETLNAKYLA